MQYLVRATVVVGEHRGRVVVARLNFFQESAAHRHFEDAVVHLRLLLERLQFKRSRARRRLEDVHGDVAIQETDEFNTAARAVRYWAERSKWYNIVLLQQPKV